jgi:hypothetical protein
MDDVTDPGRRVHESGLGIGGDPGGAVAEPIMVHRAGMRKGGLGDASSMHSIMELVQRPR